MNKGEKQTIHNNARKYSDHDQDYSREGQATETCQLRHTNFTFSEAQLIRLLRNFITDKLASLCSIVLATTAQWIAGTATSHLRNARGHFCRHLHGDKQQILVD